MTTISTTGSQAATSRLPADHHQAPGQPTIRSEPSQRITPRLAYVRGLQPLMPVLGALAGAGAAKTGYGSWAASVIALAVPGYFGVVVAAMLTRRLTTWITRAQRYEMAQRSSAGLGGVMTNTLRRLLPGIRYANRAQSRCVCRARAA